METLERLLPLFASRNRGLEGGPSATAMGIRLLPKLPIRPLGGVDLFQGKVAPIDLQPVTQLLSDCAQPDRRAVDVRSTVIEVDVERNLVVHKLSHPSSS